MGKLVQVKASVTDAVALPPLDLTYAAGETTTLTDREYAGLPSATQAALIVIASDLPDPIRVSSATSPASAADAYRMSKQYTDLAIKSVAADGFPLPTNIATETDVNNAISTSQTYTDTTVNTAISTEVEARISGDSDTLASARGYTNTSVQTETTARIAADSAEATARSAADTAETNARIAADSAEATARATAISTAITTESNARIAADALKAPLDSPALTGNATLAGSPILSTTTGIIAPASGDPVGGVPTKQSNGTVSYVVPAGGVASVNGHVGAVSLTKSDVGLSNVDNTADTSKPISTATQTALNAKADLVNGTVPRSQIPSISGVMDIVGVASQTAMLALTQPDTDTQLRVQRTDTPGVQWVLNPGLAVNSLANWIQEPFDASGAAAAVQAASLQKSSNLSDLGNAVTARTNLGLGSAATASTAAFDAAGAATTAQAASLQKTNNLSDLSNAATARTNLGLGSAATSSSSAFDAAGAAGVVQTALTSEVTRATTAEAAKRTRPGLVSTTAATGATALTKDAIQLFTPTASFSNTALPALSSCSVGDTYWLENTTSFTITQPFQSGDTTSSGATSFASSLPGTMGVVAVANPGTGPAKYWKLIDHIRSDATLQSAFVSQSNVLTISQDLLWSSGAPANSEGRDNWSSLDPANGNVFKKTSGAWSSSPTSTIPGLVYGAPGTQFISGTWQPVYNNGSAIQLVAGTGYTHPMVINKSGGATFTTVGAQITAVGSGCTYRLGIYADNGACYPGALVSDFGTTATVAAIGNLTLTLASPLTLTPGIYWLVAVPQSTTTTQSTINTVGYGLTLFGNMYGSTAPGVVTGSTGMNKTGFADGALPSTFPTGATVKGTNSIPFIALEVQ